jgi:glutamate synthase (NADPH/NADH) small chain
LICSRPCGRPSVSFGRRWKLLRENLLKCLPQLTQKFSGTEFDLDAELVLLAMGFVHPVHEGLLKMLGVDLDQRGNVRANMVDHQTSRPNVFSAGDMHRGQSPVVWAIREGRLCAQAIDRFLMGSTNLPR